MRRRIFIVLDKNKNNNIGYLITGYKMLSNINILIELTKHGDTLVDFFSCHDEDYWKEKYIVGVDYYHLKGTYTHLNSHVFLFNGVK